MNQMWQRIAQTLKKEVVARHRATVLVVLFIAAVTLRSGGGGSGSSGCLICGVRGLADFIANILLFVPLGSAIALRKGKFWHSLIVSMALSIAIELAQWRLVAGRDSNFGDVLANSTGALLGWMLVRLRPWRPLARGSAIRLYAFAFLTCALLLGALTLFAPQLYRSTYYLHWTPAYESLERYSGTVLATRLGLEEWEEGRHRQPDPADSLAQLLIREPLHVEFIAGVVTGSLAPVISISDEEQEEVLLIGIDGSDLIFRFNSRANDLRLDDVNLRVRQAFRGVQPGDTTVISMMFDQRGYCLEVNNHPRCGHGATIGDTWALLLNPHWGPAGHGAFSLLWLWLAFLPVGAVTPNRRTLAVVALGVALLLWLAPSMLGFAVTPISQVISSVVGLLTGAVPGTRIARAASHPSPQSHLRNRRKAATHPQ